MRDERRQPLGASAATLVEGVLTPSPSETHLRPAAPPCTTSTDTRSTTMTSTIRDTVHPFYGVEAERDYITECETLDELIQWAASYDEDMNFVYRWDWYMPAQEDIARAAAYGEEPPRETLTLFVVLQRKSRFLNISAPVTADDEEKVREFLTSDRILGALRRTWAPLLDAD